MIQILRPRGILILDAHHGLHKTWIYRTERSHFQTTTSSTQFDRGAETVDFHEEPTLATSHQTDKEERGTSPAKPGSELRTASISSSSMESECPSLEAISKKFPFF